MGVKEKFLINQALTGEKSAYEKLFTEYADLLYVFILHYIKGHREDAKDLWQETFIVAFENLHKFNAQSNFFTWLCGIARNKVSDYFRNKVKEENNKKDLLLQSFEYTAIPENQFVEDSKKLVVIESLAQINDKYRMLLIQKYIDNKSIEEISKNINKTYKATESLLCRARHAFVKTYTNNTNKYGKSY